MRIHHPRRGRRGFSLLEAMIAAGVLGIGLVGLARLHITSIQGVVKSEEMSSGAEVARQIADTFATLDWPSIPACLPGPNGIPTWAIPPQTANGCSSSLGPTTVFAAPKAAGCTAFFSADGVPDVSNAGWVTNPMQSDATAATAKYRVDLAVSQHPDVANFPNSLSASPDQEPVQVLWVWVCWSDESGSVHEISTSRVMSRDL